MLGIFFGLDVGFNNPTNCKNHLGSFCSLTANEVLSLDLISLTGNIDDKDTKSKNLLT